MDPKPPDQAATHPGTGHPPEDALPAGARVDEFEILGVIGMGAFSIVYRAFDHDLEREVAVKEYMPGMLANRNASGMVTTRTRSHAETFSLGLRSFVNEARLLARFDHPALLRVFRFWEANGTAYMAMPLYEGQTLGAALEAFGEPPSQAWLMAIIEPLLGALDLLRGQQVFHRDITPDNILLLPSGMPLLLDFGAARHFVTDRTQTPRAVLKPDYAPIEQYAEAPGLRQGPWTDFYALAAVVYAALTGHPPTPAATRAVVDDNASFAEIGLRLQAGHGPKFEPGFLAAWQRCLALEPADRPQSTAELRSLLGLTLVPASGNSPNGTSRATAGAAPTPQPQHRLGPSTGHPVPLSPVASAPGIPPQPPPAEPAQPVAAAAPGGQAAVADSNTSSAVSAPASTPRRPGTRSAMVTAMAVLLLVAGGYFALAGSGKGKFDDATTQQASSNPALALARTTAEGATPVSAGLSRAASNPASGAVNANNGAPGSLAAGASAPARIAGVPVRLAAPANRAASTIDSVSEPNVVTPTRATGSSDPDTADTPARTVNASAPANAPASQAEVVAAEAGPLETCGKLTLFARWSCMKRECDKPRFAQSDDCKEERERAERQAKDKLRF